MFENGERHRQQKSFLIAVCQNMLKMGRLIPNIMDIVPEHLIKWNFKEGKRQVLTPCTLSPDYILVKWKIGG